MIDNAMIRWGWILLALVLAGIASASNSADPFAEFQWALQNKGASQAVELDHMTIKRVPSRPGEDIQLKSLRPYSRRPIVAVLDTGIDKQHPEFKGQIVRKESECRALAKFQDCVQKDGRRKCEKVWMDVNHPEVDLDGNGYPMDCEGWSVIGGLNAAGIMGKPDFDDEQGHGTHVSGIIAALAGNGEGVRGCSASAQILPVQVLSRAPKEPIKPLSLDLSPVEKNGRNRRSARVLGDFVARGVIYAINSGADVINFSLGWPQARDSELLREALAEAHRRGIVIVAAAGNDSTEALLRPCSYPGVICVASHGPDGALSHFSNYGPGVDVAAPGLNILSTWPRSQRPVRFRPTYGYEYLHGTSQASPFVSCMAAEMLARGIPSSEIYPRMILGARPHQNPLALEAGHDHESENLSTGELRSTLYRKSTLAGNVDFKNALAVKEQPLILPASTEEVKILWDRRQKSLQFPFALKNYWQGTQASVSLDIQVLRPKAGAPRPKVSSLSARSWKGWGAGEQRKLVAQLKITDSRRAVDSRIPSELTLLVEVRLNGKAHRSFYLKGEVVVPVDKGSNDPELIRLGLSGVPDGRVSFLPILDVLDGQGDFRDYITVATDDQTWELTLLRQSRQGLRAPYKKVNTIQITVPEDDQRLRDEILARVDLDFDGESEYVLALKTDNINERDDEGNIKPSPVEFYYFSNDFRLLEQVHFDGEKALFPYHLNFQVQWMRLNGKKVPAWVGGGEDPDKKVTLRDLWEDPDQEEAPEIRFYYLNAKGELQTIEEPEGYKVVSTLTPTEEQVVSGRVPVLLQKNTGTELKPSYISDFAIVEIFEGRVEGLANLNTNESGVPYRNLSEPRFDSVMALDASAALYRGTFFFDQGRLSQQRISFLWQQPARLRDFHASALRGVVDAALLTRYAFNGPGGPSAFVITNSEIQFHHLLKGQAAATSLERYTFFPDYATTNLQFPTVVGSRNQVLGNSRLPALFTTEGSGFNRGVRFTLPFYDQRGVLQEMVAPARLRFEAGRGCKPVDSPFWSAAAKTSFVDYYCEDEILRLPLNY